LEKIWCWFFWVFVVVNCFLLIMGRSENIRRCWRYQRGKLHVTKVDTLQFFISGRKSLEPLAIIVLSIIMALASLQLVNESIKKWICMLGAEKLHRETRNFDKSKIEIRG
jgi:hypothetical protein